MRSTLVLLLGVAACAGSTDQPRPSMAPDGGTEPEDSSGDDAASAEFDPYQPGPWGTSVTLHDLQLGDRTVPLSIWGPSEARATEVRIEEIVAQRGEEFAELLSVAPAGCPSTAVRAALDSELAVGSWPIVVYSHCHECLGVSGASVAASLASWGHLVIVPDHSGNTLWDKLDDTGAELGSEFLEVRATDVVAILDRALTGEAPFEALAGSVDATRVALVGHSFGAVTVGWVAERDARVGAAVALAAPVENPLLPGVNAANITTPMMFLVAVEDGSITEFGNVLIRQNFEAIGGRALKLEVADAGHWSVSDLCGLTEAFMPGCDAGTRQTNGERFAFLPADDGRALTAAWVTAFIGDELGSIDGAGAWMSQAVDDRLEVRRRPEP